MTTIMDLLFSYLITTVTNRTHVSILDIGSRTGHGADLVRRTMAPEADVQISATVTATNKFEEEVAWAKVMCPLLDVKLFDVNVKEDRERIGKFDIVIASHMIEHTENPEETFDNIASMAKDYFVIACPYEEVELDHVTWKHDSRISGNLLLTGKNGKRIIRKTIRKDVSYPYCHCFYGLYKA
jgi:hypothetical protein